MKKTQKSLLKEIKKLKEKYFGTELINVDISVAIEIKQNELSMFNISLYQYQKISATIVFHENIIVFQQKIKDKNILPVEKKELKKRVKAILIKALVMTVYKIYKPKITEKIPVAHSIQLTSYPFSLSFHKKVKNLINPIGKQISEEVNNAFEKERAKLKAIEKEIESVGAMEIAKRKKVLRYWNYQTEIV